MQSSLRNAHANLFVPLVLLFTSICILTSQFWSENFVLATRNLLFVRVIAGLPFRHLDCCDWQVVGCAIYDDERLIS